jgi:hypothetical protein
MCCANAATTPKSGGIVDFSTLEPESRIELLTYSLRVIWHSTLFNVRCAQSYLL